MFEVESSRLLGFLEKNDELINGSEATNNAKITKR
jgi:hypothetical protein